MLKFSIITVCKNSEQTIERAVRSVIEQNFQDYEYIIIDGKSTDATLAILDKYKKNIAQLVSEPDTGIYDAMNKAIKLAKGEYLFFLNADDKFLHNNVLDVVQNNLRMGVDIFYGYTLSLNAKTGRAYIGRKFQPNRRILFARTIPHQAAFIAKTAFAKVGYYDDALRICADYEWFLRAILKYKCSTQTYEFVCAVNYLGGASNNARTAEIGGEERRAIQKKYFNFLERKFYNNYLGRKLASLLDDAETFVRNFGFEP